MLAFLTHLQGSRVDSSWAGVHRAVFYDYRRGRRQRFEVDRLDRAAPEVPDDFGPTNLTFFSDLRGQGDNAMEKSKFTEVQIAAAPRGCASDAPVGRVARKRGTPRSRPLEEESSKLKRLVADLSLDKVPLQTFSAENGTPDEGARRGRDAARRLPHHDPSRMPPSRAAS